jgi:metal-responsive CopG/Arc/MetJ family transcriptional regulator
MDLATERHRYTVSIDNDLFQKLEDFRYSNRFQTRSEATVELIRLGLEAMDKEQTEQKEGEPEGVIKNCV